MLKLLGGFGLVAGATYPLRAIWLILRTPSLWHYLIVPILVNLVLAIALYGGIVFLGWQQVSDWMGEISNTWEEMAASLPGWLDFLYYGVIGLGYLLKGVLLLVILLAIGFLLVQFGSILGSPWYGKLSEAIEKRRQGRVETLEVGIVKDIWRAILFEIKKLVVAIGIGMLFFALGFLPIIGGAIAGVGGTIAATLLVCLDFFDAPLERRRLRFRHKLKIALRSFPASGSFGFICLGLASIPLLNLLTIPLCVAAGTLFICDRVLPRLPTAVNSRGAVSR